MAEAGFYTIARSRFLAGGLNWLADTPPWRAFLLTPDYVVDLDAHQTLADLQPAAAVSTSGDILGRSIVSGYARAAAVATIGGNIGQEVAQMVIACGNTLVWYSNDSSDFPYIADGGPAYLVWDALVQAPFRL